MDYVLRVSQIELNAVLVGLCQLQQAMKKPDGLATFGDDVPTSAGQQRPTNRDD